MRYKTKHRMEMDWHRKMNRQVSLSNQKEYVIERMYMRFARLRKPINPWFSEVEKYKAYIAARLYATGDEMFPIIPIAARLPK